MNKTILQKLTGGPHNYFMCLTFISSMLALSTVSIFSMVAVSVDRYFAICHPIVYRRTSYARTIKPMIATCWLLGILGLIPLFGWNVGVLKNKCHPSSALSFDYIVFLCIVAAFIPGTAIIIIYSMIFKEFIMQVGKFNSNEMFN